MIKKLLVLTLLTGPLLLGCGGGGDSGNSFAGIWHSTSADEYLEIQSSGLAKHRVCSINDGYPVRNVGRINGNTLEIDSETYGIWLENDILNVLRDYDDRIFEFIRAWSVPDACAGDAIEITYVSPARATEGALTTFIVNFDYRLSSTTSGIVDLGFNLNDADTFRFTGGVLEITGTGTGSGSLSAEVSPVFYEPPESFKAAVSLWRNSDPTGRYGLAWDETAVTVDPGVSALVNSSTGGAKNPVNYEKLCSNDMLTPCLEEVTSTLPEESQ